MNRRETTWSLFVNLVPQLPDSGVMSKEKQQQQKNRLNKRGQINFCEKIPLSLDKFSDFWPQYSTSFIIVLFDLLQVSSLIVCHVFRASPEHLSKALI